MKPCYTDKELLDNIYKLFKELGKPPTGNDCNACIYTANVSTYRNRFGSWVKAKELAGISTRSSEKSDEELIDSLKIYFNVYNKVPKQEDCKAENYMHSSTVYIARFGSWSNALYKAGLKEPKIASEILLHNLKEFYRVFKRAPTQKDCNGMSHMVYVGRFGSWNNALNLADVPLNKVGSKCELDLREEVSKLYTGNIIYNSRKILSGKELDIYLPDIKLAIEFDGLYWHGEDHKDSKYHINKTKEANDAGIRLIHIFENEWEYKRDIVLARLKHILGASQDSKVYARKCEIVEINSKVSAEFMESNHIQGNANASVHLGMYYLGVLVAVQTFCKSRFTKDCEWELLRYSSSVPVIGGASRLFAYFVRKYNPKSIVSYSDIRWNTGSVYTKLGFRLSHISQPNYWYYKGKQLESRHKYQKHKLEDILPIFKEELSEAENMQANGYKRIYDCGNMVFKWSGEHHS